MELGLWNCGAVVEERKGRVEKEDRKVRGGIQLQDRASLFRLGGGSNCPLLMHGQHIFRVIFGSSTRPAIKVWARYLRDFKQTSAIMPGMGRLSEGADVNAIITAGKEAVVTGPSNHTWTTRLHVRFSAS